MPKIIYKNGQTGVILRVKILDTSSTTGGGKTGLTSATSGLVISTIADNEATATAYSGSNLETITTLGTYAAPTSGKARFKEVDSSGHPGLYEIHLANARYAVSNAKTLIVTISGATGAAQTDAEIQLSQLDMNDAVRAGLTALPNANAGANGGLPLGDASGRVDLTTDALDADALKTDAVTELQTGLATSTNQATILSNQATIAGYIDTEVGAIKAKTDNLPAAPAAVGDIPTVAQIDTQLSGTHGAGSWDAVASGSGARSVTVTVDDGTNPLAAATVRMTAGSATYEANTNGSGVASFNLDDGSYTLSILKTGYTYVASTVTVSSTSTAFTASMDANTVPAPSDPTKESVTFNLDTAGADQVAIYYEDELPLTLGNTTIDDDPAATGTADADTGQLTLEVYATATITGGNTGTTGLYTILFLERGSIRRSWEGVSVPVGGGTFNAGTGVIS